MAELPTRQPVQKYHIQVAFNFNLHSRSSPQANIAVFDSCFICQSKWKDGILWNFHTCEMRDWIVWVLWSKHKLGPSSSPRNPMICPLSCFIQSKSPSAWWHHSCESWQINFKVKNKTKTTQWQTIKIFPPAFRLAARNFVRHWQKMQTSQSDSTTRKAKTYATE